MMSDRRAALITSGTQQAETARKSDLLRSFDVICCKVGGAFAKTGQNAVPLTHQSRLS